MLFGRGKDMTPIDFGFTKSKAKVTRVLFVSAKFPDNYLSELSFHMLIVVGEDMDLSIFDSLD